MHHHVESRLSISVHGCGAFGRDVSEQVAVSTVGNEMVMVVCDQDDHPSVDEARQHGLAARGQALLTLGFMRAPTTTATDARALAARQALAESVDSLIVVPGTRESVHAQMVLGLGLLVHVVTKQGIVCIDAADVRFLFGECNRGVGTMAAVETAGPDRLGRAVRAALDTVTRDQFVPTAMLLMVGYGGDVQLNELQRALEGPELLEDGKIELIFAMNQDSATPGPVRVTVIATAPRAIGVVDDCSHRSQNSSDNSKPSVAV